MKNTTGLAVLAVGGLAIWALTTGKISLPGVAAAAVPKADPTRVATTPIAEPSGISLSVWQGLTGAQLQTMPVTQNTGVVGRETYYKASAPVAIGDTGFKVWGLTASGAPVVSMNDPSTYPVEDWF